jgi:hypothetical protein
LQNDPVHACSRRGCCAKGQVGTTLDERLMQPNFSEVAQRQSVIHP